MIKYKIDKYQFGGNICVTVIKDGETYGKLSLNMHSPLDPPLKFGEFVAKVYSENASWAQDLLDGPDFIITDRIVHIGTYNIPCPVCKLSPKLIRTLFEETYNSKADIYEAEPILWQLYDTIK